MEDKNGTAYLYTYAKSDVDSTEQQIIACANAYAKEVGAKLPSTLVIHRNGGKPFFENASGIHFSVSHSGELWACAFCDVPLGLDIQHRVPCNQRGVANRFFHPDEKAHLLANDYADFFEIWVAKESYVKYTGHGIDDDFASFCVVKGGKLIQKAGNAYFLHIRTRPDYSLCICSGCPLQTVEPAL